MMVFRDHKLKNPFFLSTKHSSELLINYEPTFNFIIFLPGFNIVPCTNYFLEQQFSSFNLSKRTDCAFDSIFVERILNIVNISLALPESKQKLL